MTIGGVGAIQIGAGTWVCDSFESVSFDASARVSVGPICVSMHVAGLQQDLIAAKPTGAEGSQQPCCAVFAGAESDEEPHPPHEPEHPLRTSVEQHAIAAFVAGVAERQPMYDQPRKGWSVMARMRARMRNIGVRVYR